MPILMTREEYDRIKKWTNPDKEDPEAKRQREYIEYLDKQSAEITKSWPNSLENVNKRNEEMRRARTESHDNANARFYKNYVKRKKEEQERMMYSARDMIFKNKDAPKLLLSAVVESVILKEREEQIKFNNKYVGEYEREQARLYEEKVLRQAKEWNELQQERKRRRFQFNKQHQKDILDQIKEIDDRKRKEYEEELTQQKMDIENSNKEMQAIKEFEMNFKETERQRIWRDNEQAVKEREQRKREQAMRDHMDDQLLEVLTRSQARVEARRKATEKEVRKQSLQEREQRKREQAMRDHMDDQLLEVLTRSQARVEARRKATEKEVRKQSLKERSNASYGPPFFLNMSDGISTNYESFEASSRLRPGGRSRRKR
ncbi:hypothetical protein NE865_14812 [Phthorimaea operculella]|nr:hypothetical protein NE865_14812 [Phthorimaea operculella]